MEFFGGTQDRSSRVSFDQSVLNARLRIAWPDPMQFFEQMVQVARGRRAVHYCRKGHRKQDD
jgi:hypothetical protein